MNQTDGIEIPRWGSLARSAPPLELFDGATTQLFDPIWWSPAIPSPPSSPARRRNPSSIEATSRQAAAWSAVMSGASRRARARVGSGPPTWRPVVAAAVGVITGMSAR